jgi:hypothetical protein
MMEEGGEDLNVVGTNVKVEMTFFFKYSMADAKPIEAKNVYGTG